MKTYVDIEKIYGKFNLKDLETQAHACLNASYANRKKLIEILAWIEMSKEYKTNPIYKKESFSVYLYDKFMIRYTTFLQERKAFVAFEKESLQYGPKIVIKALDTCGPLETPKVFKKITPKTTRSQISKIILQHARPRNIKPKKRSVAFLEAELTRANEKIRLLHKELKKKDAQVIKLKATVKRYQHIFDVPISSLLPEESGTRAKM